MIEKGAHSSVDARFMENSASGYTLTGTVMVSWQPPACKATSSTPSATS